MGSKEQIELLNESLGSGTPVENPVVVIGGGRVGRAAVQALRKQNVQVHLLERDAGLKESLSAIPDRLIIGDAADRETFKKAGWRPIRALTSVLRPERV